jgi:hypothetical protein
MTKEVVLKVEVPSVPSVGDNVLSGLFDVARNNQLRVKRKLSELTGIEQVAKAGDQCRLTQSHSLSGIRSVN